MFSRVSVSLRCGSKTGKSNGAARHSVRIADIASCVLMGECAISRPINGVFWKCVWFFERVIGFLMGVFAFSVGVIDLHR